MALLNQSYLNKDFQQLNKDAELALEYYPNKSQFLYYYGASSSILEDYSAAVYSFNKLKKIAAKDKILSAKASLELGSIYTKQAKSEQAQKQFDDALKLIESEKSVNPEDSRVFELLGDYYANVKAPELAEVEWKTAIEKGAKINIDEKLESFGYKKE